MDPLRAVLLALARKTHDAQQRWLAGRAALRAREQQVHRNEVFAHYMTAESCLIAALDAANLPSGYRIGGTRLTRDPVVAMQRLRDHPIEADREPARQDYLDAYTPPLTEAEAALADRLAALPAARRDRIFDHTH
ncbi:hypothetical protein GCM10010112_82710 [Actinoplanes lobatus]|uniref:Uncharacterized protein n=1 Tax=Actinoplanes lobatus TaxID=113568 RepID=A0A7W7HL37_9ACTN|nr:hypothetical protein [Actinoplanes lobatus]MBB4752541.1 hypothetical protein [Actinoplanes lobatus]GGN93912.1 hypothetical protein GCM10010112_82710 [Actinoplanes lobatus]GIE44840.1 hypothetical protein Alo02nite_77380 [Actinoplanes lobatus]